MINNLNALELFLALMNDLCHTHASSNSRIAGPLQNGMAILAALLTRTRLAQLQAREGEIMP